MSTNKGVNTTLMDAGTIVDPGMMEAPVKCFIDTYEADEITAASTIEMGPVLPKGARIVDFVIYHDALGTGVTLSVGDGTTANKFLAATAAATAGSIRPVLASIGDALAADTQLYLTSGSAAADGTIRMVVFYVHN